MSDIQKKRLYIVIFTAKSTGETFIKVGISAHHIEQRFAADLVNFDVEIVFESDFYKSRDALIVESNFHSIVGRFSYAPKIRLKSGNTECFVNSLEVLVELAKIFNSKRHTPKPAAPIARQDKHVRRAKARVAEEAAMRWETPSDRRRRTGDYHGGPGWDRLYKQVG